MAYLVCPCLTAIRLKKRPEGKTLRIKDTSGLHLYRVRPSHSFTPSRPSRPPWVQLPPRTPLGHLSGISYGIHFGLTPPGYGATDSTSSHVHDIDIDRRNQTNHASSFVLPLGHSWAPLMASTLVQLLRGGFGIRRNRFNKLTGS